MWTDLFLATLLAISILLVPGFVAVRALGARWEFALSAAPLVTLAAYGVLSIAYGAFGIPCGWVTLAVPVTVVAAAAWAVRSRRGTWRETLGFGEKFERPLLVSGPLRYLTPVRLALLLGVCAAAATAIAVYVSSLGDPNAFEQTYDNAWHLSRVHMFAETQNFSTLNETLYPSAWHGIAAMVELTLGVSSALAEHAANLAFIIGVFPVGSVALLATLFPERPRLVALGGMLCLSFAFFPWRIMLFGPLYPNLAAFSLMPIEAALFILLCSKGVSVSQRARYGVLFVFGGAAMALAQPNAIFSTGAFLIPYCVWRFRKLVYDALGEHRNRMLLSICAACVLVAFIAAAWVILANAPFMQAVVTYPRETPLSVGQAVRWGLGFSFVIRRQQFFIAAVVALGALVLLARPRTRWVPCSYALLLLLYAVAISCSGTLRNLIAGFWYSDYYRLAATACVFCVPLVAAGMDAIVGGTLWCAKKAGEHVAGHSGRIAQKAGIVVSAFVVAGIMALNYVPFDFVPGYLTSWGFDAVRYEMRDLYQNTENFAFDEEEVAFAERARQMVPDGAEIYNVPFDGSAFAYADCDLNVSYKSFGPEGDSNLLVLQKGLDNIANDPAVKAAAEAAGIRYVILLDQGGKGSAFSEDGTLYLLGYGKDDWLGATGVTDETPGFECLLAEGDMRLYEIVV